MNGEIITLLITVAVTAIAGLASLTFVLAKMLHNYNETAQHMAVLVKSSTVQEYSSAIQKPSTAQKAGNAEGRYVSLSDADPDELLNATFE